MSLTLRLRVLFAISPRARNCTIRVPKSAGSICHGKATNTLDRLALFLGGLAYELANLIERVRQPRIDPPPHGVLVGLIDEIGAHAGEELVPSDRVLDESRVSR